MSWSEVGNNSSGSSSGEGKVNYLAIPVGVTKIRIVDSEPKSRWTHWIQSANAGKGMGITCCGKGCPACASIASSKKIKEAPKYNSTKNHAINVIDRSVGEIRLMDKGNSIFGQIVDIMGQMPDIQSYDLTITRRGEGRDASYTVIPSFPPIPLTQAELALEKYDLEAVTKPFTIAQTVALMNGEMLDTVIAMEASNEVPLADQASVLPTAANQPVQESQPQVEAAAPRKATKQGVIPNFPSAVDFNNDEDVPFN